MPVAKLKPLKPKSLPLSISTDRLTLRRVSPSMARLVFEAVDKNRRHLDRFLPWVGFIKAVEDESKWIKACLKTWKERSQFVYAVFLADGTYLGNIDAHHVEWPHHRVELGYWIVKSHEGHGYVGESVRGLEQALFGAGFHRIEIRCNTSNKRSANIPQRNGYKFEGILHQDRIEHGRYCDTMIFAKLNRQSSK